MNRPEDRSPPFASLPRKSVRTRLSAATVVGVALSLLIAPAAFAQSDEILFLIERAENWETANQPELARQEWERILQIDSENVTALVAVIRLDAATGRQDDAQRRVAELRRLAPEHPDLEELSLAIEFAPRDSARLEQARQRADAGDAESAVRLYREAFNGRAPSPALADAFYHQMLELPGGREQAITELRQIVERGEGPTRPYIALLGKIRTYDPDDRIAGMRLLQSVASSNRDDDAGRAALSAWRQALLWEEGSARSAESLQAFIALEDDRGLRQLRDRAQAQAARTAVDQQRARGYRALERSDFTTAERVFEGFLDRNPNSIVDLEGLASVRLGQRRTNDAIVLIDRALERARGGDRTRLQRLRDDAILAEGFHEVEVARARNDERQMLAVYERLIEQFPSNADARTARGALLRALGDRAAAIQDYRRALTLQPDSAAIRTTLIELWLESDQPQEALRLIEELDTARRNHLRRDPAWLLTEVSVQQANGDQRAARAAFERAQRLPLPNDANDRLRLAWARHNLDPGARETDELIDRIRSMSLTPAQTDELANLADAHFRATLDQLVREGQYEAADRRMQRAERERPSDPAVQTLRNNLDITVAWDLYERRNFHGLYAKLMELHRRTSLNSEQAQELQTLFRVGAAAEAEPLKQQRHFAAAAAIYENLNRMFPRDPHYLRELGYLYLEADQPEDAWVVLNAAGPEDTAGSYSAFLGAALGASQFREAERLRDEALKRFPNNPDLWELAGTLEETRGRRRNAIYYYEQALALRHAADAAAQTAARAHLQPFPRASASPMPAFSGVAHDRL